jgi:hypothetical protein
MKYLFTKLVTILTVLFVFSMFTSCVEDEEAPEVIEEEPIVPENISSFKEVGTIDIGGAGAAEISAFDATSKKLFVVNNDAAGNKIDVINFSNPASPSDIGDILIVGGAANSVACYNGFLAVAIEDANKQNNGRIEVYKTSDLSKVKTIIVGALPDMVTFSADGAYIVTANEGEPNEGYTVDPDGSISIIEVNNDYAVTTLGFAAFANPGNGFRVFGAKEQATKINMIVPLAPANITTLAKDVEPEYVTISKDSKTAWVSLQEANGIAKVNLETKTITNIFPLGFKDYSKAENSIDASDKPNTTTISFTQTLAGLYGVYMPDAIAYFEVNGTPYIISANEGDSRLRPTADGIFAEAEFDKEGEIFNEEARIKDLTLDATAFPTAADVKTDAKFGRLKVTKSMGDTDGDGDYDKLYAFGSRSFTIWNPNSGSLIYDSQNKLETDLYAAKPAKYDDGRSDDKGVEPEGVAVGVVNGKTIAFVGCERVDAVLSYDITDPKNPVFLQVLEVGDAPEGLIFISAKDSPTGHSLVVVSSEGDGVVKVFQADAL